MKKLLLTISQYSMLESLFDKVADLTLLTRDSNTGIFLEIFRNF